MKLYHMIGACSLADLIVLEWLGVPYEKAMMTRDTLKSAQYLALNASGTVPLLADGELLLTENVAILGYLADLHPEARLLGDGSARGRAEVMRWLAFLNSDVHKAFKPIFTPARFLPDPGLASALADNARIHLAEYFARLDARLQGRDWLTGERSIADPYLYVVTRWAQAKGVPLPRLDNLARFFARMQADTGVRAALVAEEVD